MNSLKLSVCISVHNTGHLLSRCLDSVIGQSYKNIEIILVNNGSTDQSIDVMRHYEQQYDNIFVYEQIDKGLAQGRQSGINHAIGDYISFLDADDYIFPGMYEEMMSVAVHTGADIVECETKREGVILSSPYEGLHECSEILEDYFNGCPIQSMLWLRFYKRNLFEKAVFPQTYVNNEDVYALPCILSTATTIYFIKKCFHMYSTDNENAEMNKITDKKYDDEKLLNIKIKALHAIDFIENFIGSDEINKKYKESFEHFKSRNIVYFCTAQYKKIKAYKLINILEHYFGMNERELNKFYRENIGSPVVFDKIATILGLKTAIVVYRLLKKISRRR